MPLGEPAEPILSDVIRSEKALNVGMTDLNLASTPKQVHFRLEVREGEILVHCSCLHALGQKHERSISTLRLINLTWKPRLEDQHGVSMLPPQAKFSLRNRSCFASMSVCPVCSTGIDIAQWQLIPAGRTLGRQGPEGFAMTGRIFVIGASLSGIDALCRLIGELPAGFPAPIFITQHVASHSPGLLPHILTQAGRLPAVHPKSADLIQAGRIYVAPPDRHMLIEKGYVKLSHGPHENLARPAIDPLFRSAAMAFGPAAVGVVLTGQLDDGTAGLLAIKDRGGLTIVQDPSEATAPSMPQSALRHVAVDHCLKLKDIAALLVRLADDDPPEDPQEDLEDLLTIENRIAEGIFSVEDWWGLEQMSAPSGLNCPTCRSALYELKDKRILRFRCRSGHAFSVQCLLSGQSEAREMLLSSLFGAAIEEATLAKRMLGLRAYKEDPAFVDGLSGRIGLLEREATQVSEWLHVTTGVVEPEPTPWPPSAPP